MSSSRTLYLFRFRQFCVYAAIATSSIIAFCQIGTGQVNDSNDRPPVSDTAPVSDLSKAGPMTLTNERGSSALWQRFIGEDLSIGKPNDPEHDQVSETYQRGGMKPFFITSRFELNQGAAQLLSRLQTLDQDDIDSGPFRLEELYQSIETLDRDRSALRALVPYSEDIRSESLLDANPPTASTGESTERLQSQEKDSEELSKKYLGAFQAACDVDIRLTAAFLLFARTMGPYFDKEKADKALSGEIPVSDFVKELEPKTLNYAALRTAYERYKKLAAGGEQQSVTLSKARHGESGTQVRDLQKRLQQEGFYSGDITGVYDHETKQAVKQFQTAHMLDPDGTMGERTRRWLNVSFQQKADLIARSMGAERQSPSGQFDRFIRINIPQFLLEYYKDGQLQETHRIVVGQASGKKVKFRGGLVGENQTPTLTSTVIELVINPRWYVSDRIHLELEASAKSDPDWYTRHGYVSMRQRYASGAHRIFQSPGPKNALGLVKFEFPNPYAVYMHDTPLKHLFARSRRDFSHGCIRVDNALGLAKTLLKDDNSPYAEKIESLLKMSKQAFVKLSQPVPISIEYIPVVAVHSSQIVFATDLYEKFNEKKATEVRKSISK